MCIFCSTFEGTDLATLAHLEITFAKCGKYFSTLVKFSKSSNTLHSIISISLSNELE